MSPGADDPHAQDRIDVGAQVLQDARAIYGELCAVLDDLDLFVQDWAQGRKPEEPQ